MNTTRDSAVAENKPASSKAADQQQQKVAASQASVTTPRAEYSLSGGLIRRLVEMNASLAFTSYQSGLLYMLGSNAAGAAQLHQSAMPKPMGLRADGNGGLVLSAGAQVMRFANVLEPDQRINQTYDACFMPRVNFVTGQLDAHDVGVDASGEAVFVNTRFNCLARPSARHSFEAIWKPDFISELVDEDRCHLNGLAMKDGRPAFVTAVSRSDTIDGWRDRRVDGGVVIDVERNAIVCEGLSMPHSPRWHGGKLWVLNAGTGEFGHVELPSGKAKTGKFVPVAFCPGFLRGLAFHGKFAFVGLSRPRYRRFEGLALDEKLKASDSEAWCGVQVIDTETGTCVDWFRIDGDIGELYDVELVEGFRCPMTVSPTSPDAATLITFGQP
ncbi:TIGR03032 family protein [Alteraurantiacibacter aquimixticola]|uniref:TIGR03032 family protein n=1 Tax=Alteraurantiacibacter aquimixticola TaxID=2489173 RepID=A0A4T3F504_9SPHN|nr:TIGR03032 family protein [Alteraurantiacibacter aquimixticola]TIX49813.1 TIGR03032 family protein [Alteraurantiacibacter aquimixticola]